MKVKAHRGKRIEGIIVGLYYVYIRPIFSVENKQSVADSFGKNFINSW